MFCSITKGVLLNCIPILFLKYFMLDKNAPCNAISLELDNPFEFQPIIYSVHLSFLNSKTCFVLFEVTFLFRFFN